MTTDRIFLYGPPGAGKSVTGRRLGESLGLPFIDLDREIEKLAGVEIAVVFSQSGEATFRQLERKALRSLRYKFVRVYPTQAQQGWLELYDLKEDPGEQSNIADASPELVEALNARLEAITSGIDIKERDEELPDEIDPALREQLEALGYLGQ